MSFTAGDNSFNKLVERRKISRKRARFGLPGIRMVLGGLSRCAQNSAAGINLTNKAHPMVNSVEQNRNVTFPRSERNHIDRKKNDSSSFVLDAVKWKEGTSWLSSAPAWGTEQHAMSSKRQVRFIKFEALGRWKYRLYSSDLYFGNQYGLSFETTVRRSVSLVIAIVIMDLSCWVSTNNNPCIKSKCRNLISATFSARKQPSSIFLTAYHCAGFAAFFFLKI